MLRKVLAEMIEIADSLDEKGHEEDAAVITSIVEKLAAKKKWIPKDLKEGRFTEWCKRNGFDGPCKACAEKALNSDDASVRGMGSFYMNVAAK